MLTQYPVKIFFFSRHTHSSKRDAAKTGHQKTPHRFRQDGVSSVFFILSVRLWHLALSGRLSCGHRACPSRTLHRHYLVAIILFNTKPFIPSTAAAATQQEMSFRTKRSEVEESLTTSAGRFLAFASISPSYSAHHVLLSSPRRCYAFCK